MYAIPHAAGAGSSNSSDDPPASATRHARRVHPTPTKPARARHAPLTRFVPSSLSACRVVNFCSDDPDDMEVNPEVGHRQPERRADEEAALRKVRAVLKEQLGKVLAALLEELKQK